MTILAHIPGGVLRFAQVREVLAELPVAVRIDGTDLVVVPDGPIPSVHLMRARVAAKLGAE